MSNESNTLTYIFGAGASYNAIPVVEEFKLSQFSGGFLDCFNAPVLKPFRDKFLHIITAKLPFEYSIDTYIKKQKLARNEQKYKEALLFLDLFLIFKHCYRYEYKYKTSQGTTQTRSFTTIDNRYDSLYASILEEIDGNYVFPKNLNIISWNYDLMFESALSFLPDTIKETSKLINDTGGKIGLNLCRLNGSIDRSSKALDLIDTCSKEKMDNQENTELFQAYAHERIRLYHEEESIDYIKFAWDDISEEVERAKKMIQDTANLVVIGYSFPTYNRLIDQKILSTLDGNSLQNVYIQDLPSKYSEIKSKFKSLSPTSINKSKVVAYIDKPIHGSEEIELNTLLNPTSGTAEFFIPPTWIPEY